MLIVRTEGAPRPGGRLRRRARRVDAEAEPEVPVTRVTVTRTRQLSEADAAAWVKEVTAAPERTRAEVREAVALINRAVGAHRVASGDPLVPDVGATRALAIRLGHGTGEQLARAGWTDARQLPRPPKPGRLDGVDPQTRVAAVLSGRDQVHPAETLLLRARLDLAAGRVREAALQMPEAARGLLGHPGAAEGSEEARGELSAALDGLEAAAAEAREAEPGEKAKEALATGVRAARELAASIERATARAD